jgi:adenine-specific DNA-methyltransferase
MPPTFHHAEPVPHSSADLVDEQLARLRQIFPEVFSEDQVDFDRLRATLGEAGALLDDDGAGGAYTFTWAGKAEAFRAMQTPSAASLAPAPDESVNWDETRHLFIEGENLEVLKLLYKSYFGKVKMIYIDPPYNTGNDFIYRDDYREPRRAYLEKTGQMDAEGNVLTSNPETGGRYHSDWLTMMYPRLFLARQLLREDGVIFVSIDDHEVHHLRLLMNEIFGEENFIAQIIILTNPKGRVLGEHFAQCHDYLLVYSKAPLEDELSLPKSEEEIVEQYPDSDELGRYRLLELRNTHRQFGKFNRPNLFYPLYINPETGNVFCDQQPNYIEVYPIWGDGFEGCWTWGKKKVRQESHLLLGREVNDRWKIYRKSYAFDDEGKIARKKLKTIWVDREFQTEKGQASFDELISGRVFPSPKPVAFLKTLLRLATAHNQVVLDFFSGSGTIAQAVLELNCETGSARRFIAVQIPEPTDVPDFPTIADIGKERIRRVIARMAGEGDRHLKGAGHLGFKVFKLAPSTLRRWAPPAGETAEALGQQLAMFDRGLEAGADPRHVIYEVLLKLGYSLNARIEPLDLASNHVYRVTDEVPGTWSEAIVPGTFYICLDGALQNATLDALPLDKETTFVCLDAALDDSQKVNLAMACLLKVI